MITSASLPVNWWGGLYNRAGVIEKNPNLFCDSLFSLYLRSRETKNASVLTALRHGFCDGGDATGALYRKG